MSCSSDFFIFDGNLLRENWGYSTIRTQLVKNRFIDFHETWHIHPTKIWLFFGHAPVIFGHGPVIFKFLTWFYLAKLWELCLANMISQELVRRIFFHLHELIRHLIGTFGCGRGKIFSFLRGVFSERGRSRWPCSI